MQNDVWPHSSYVEWRLLHIQLVEMLTNKLSIILANQGGLRLLEVGKHDTT